MYRRPAYLLAAVASLIGQGMKFLGGSSAHDAVLRPQEYRGIRAQWRALRSKYNPQNIVHAKAGSGATAIQDEIIAAAIEKRARRAGRGW